jgi:predicted O-methyltransferase YrrM
MLINNTKIKNFINQLIFLFSIGCPLSIDNKAPLIKFRKVKTTFDCGTHICSLVTAVTRTDGPVLEIGSGDFSTPVLHAICKSQGRFLLTLDNQSRWLNYFRDLESSSHVLHYAPALLEFLKKNESHWSVVFIDHAPAYERGIALHLLQKKADVFVLHDSESQGYGYGQYLSLFKYCYTDERYETTTTLVSNVFDVSQWFQ